MHTSSAYAMQPAPPGAPAPGSPPFLPFPTRLSPPHVAGTNAGVTSLLNHLLRSCHSLTGSSCPPSVRRPASRGLVRVPASSSRHDPRVKLTSAISRLPTPIVSAGPLCLAQNRSSAVPWPVRVERLASSVSRQLQSHVSKLTTDKM